MLNKCAGITVALIAIASQATPVQAEILTFNSNTPSDNVGIRQQWLNAMGISNPRYRVSFERGFANGQNISGTSFGGGLLVITDASPSRRVIIRSGTGVIGGSNPVGVYSATQNEQPYLVLDFSNSPVDYVGFQDIDQSGTTGIVTFTDGQRVNISFETTAAQGNSAEFLGIYRNNRPRITKVELDASGDGNWGIDNIEFGVRLDSGYSEF